MSSIANEHDAATIGFLLSGHRGAIESFVRANSGWMHRLARRYVADDALAEDCVQESFANVFRSLHHFGHRCRLKSWLHRIVVNTSLMKLRTIHRRREDSLEAAMPELNCDGARIGGDWCDDTTPADVLERSETVAVVLGAIDRLPDNYRIVLRMLDIDGFDTAEAATALDLSPANVKVRLHRARCALRKLVEPALTC